MKMSVYLTFSGNCHVAMTFYQQCFGGSLRFQKLGETPLPDKIPSHFKSLIIKATLINNDFDLIATDFASDTGLVTGNNISLHLNCSSKSQIFSLYNKLSKNGKQLYPVKETHYGDLQGSVTDKFGINWLLHFSKK